jgi:hypothetical protein
VARVPLYSYLLCEALIIAFAALVIIHTISISKALEADVLLTSDAQFLAQDLIAYRAVLTALLFILYFTFRFLRKKTTLILQVTAMISWVVFLEDAIALDNVFYVPELFTGKLLQILRPIYLLVIIYMMIESRNREMHDE